MFAEAYAMNRAAAAQSVIEEDLVANAIRRLMRDQDIWEGGSAALLAALDADLPKDRAETIKLQKAWPKATNALSNRMNKVAGVLRKVGIVIKGSLTKKTRLRYWRINHGSHERRDPSRIGVVRERSLLSLLALFS